MLGASALCFGEAFPDDPVGDADEGDEPGDEGEEEEGVVDRGEPTKSPSVQWKVFDPARFVCDL